VTLDPHAILRKKVIENVLDSDAESPASRRRAAFDRKGVPPDLQALIDKVEAHAYKVTDDDLRRLQERYSDDELFELIVAAALGASERRLLAGLEALDNA
jgi:hypothetical protein